MTRSLLILAVVQMCTACASSNLKHHFTDAEREPPCTQSPNPAALKAYLAYCGGMMSKEISEASSYRGRYTVDFRKSENRFGNREAGRVQGSCRTEFGAEAKVASNSVAEGIRDRRCDTQVLAELVAELWMRDENMDVYDIKTCVNIIKRKVKNNRLFDTEVAPECIISPHTVSRLELTSSLEPLKEQIDSAIGAGQDLFRCKQEQVGRALIREFSASIVVRDCDAEKEAFDLELDAIWQMLDEPARRPNT